MQNASAEFQTLQIKWLLIAGRVFFTPQNANRKKLVGILVACVA
jgi:hypothetical protein